MQSTLPMPAEPSAAAPEAPVAPLELAISGMTCASCVVHVERALRGVAGVREVAVDLLGGKARVEVAGGEAQREPLMQAVAAAGYEVVALADARGADEEAAGRRAAGLGVALAAPLVALAMLHGALPHAIVPAAPWIELGLATLVLALPGRRILVTGARALLRRAPDMNSLVAIGAVAAWLFSAGALLAWRLAPAEARAPRPELYFEASAAILAFVLVGRLVEARARRRLGDSVRDLHALVPARATRVSGGGDEQVPVASLRAGDRVRVRPGERVPADGTIIEGETTVDESLMSGESLPVAKGPRDRVVGGALNHAGALLVELDAGGGEGALARIAAAVAAAQAGRAPISRLADRVSARFVPVVLVLAAATFLGWTLTDPSAQGIALAVERMVAVLVIACPCALGLATPAAIAVGTGRAAQLGVLFKGADLIEAASRIDTVVLDKTGTLTTGEPELAEVVARDGGDVREVLALAAAVELGSVHPIARAVVAGARGRGIEPAPVRHSTNAPGRGARALVGGDVVHVGTASWLREQGIDPTPLEADAQRLDAQGRTTAFVARGDELVGLVAVADRTVPGAAAAVATLRRHGFAVELASGDRAGAAAAIARAVGIADVRAPLLPEQKEQRIASAQAAGRRVAMVGDGVNDAPALARADVGIAIGGAADAADSAAGITLLRGGVTALPAALLLARAVLATIRRNLAFAFAYNLLAVPLAAGVLAPFTGLSLSPMVASAAMSLSSLSVLASSSWLRRFAPPSGMP